MYKGVHTRLQPTCWDGYQGHQTIGTNFHSTVTTPRSQPAAFQQYQEQQPPDTEKGSSKAIVDTKSVRGVGLIPMPGVAWMTTHTKRPRDVVFLNQGTNGQGCPVLKASMLVG